MLKVVCISLFVVLTLQLCDYKTCDTCTSAPGSYVAPCRWCAKHGSCHPFGSLNNPCNADQNFKTTNECPSTSAGEDSLSLATLRSKGVGVDTTNIPNGKNLEDCSIQLFAQPIGMTRSGLCLNGEYSDGKAEEAAAAATSAVVLDGDNAYNDFRPQGCAANALGNFQKWELSGQIVGGSHVGIFFTCPKEKEHYVLELQQLKHLINGKTYNLNRIFFKRAGESFIPCMGGRTRIRYSSNGKTKLTTTNAVESWADQFVIDNPFYGHYAKNKNCQHFALAFFREWVVKWKDVPSAGVSTLTMNEDENMEDEMADALELLEE